LKGKTADPFANHQHRRRVLYGVATVLNMSTFTVVLHSTTNAMQRILHNVLLCLHKCL